MPPNLQAWRCRYTGSPPQEIESNASAIVSYNHVYDDYIVQNNNVHPLSVLIIVHILTRFIRGGDGLLYISQHMIRGIVLVLVLTTKAL